MALDNDSHDFSNFKKVIICDGRQYDEFSNFYVSRFTAEDTSWPTAEHYYQALKFPGPDGAQLRETLRCAPSPMECWKLGNDAGKALLRPDWEDVKVECMHQANFLKFSQSDSLRLLLIGSQGPIRCDGGLFWKTWNEIILERLREELRDDVDCDREALAFRVALMDRYSAAAASGNPRAADAVTNWAAKRQVPEERDSDVPSEISVSGLTPGQVSVFQADPLTPMVNGCGHWINDEGWHLYLGSKNGRRAWVVDECLCANEATGFACREAVGQEVPQGAQLWNVWDDGTSRHSARKLTLSF